MRRTLYVFCKQEISPIYSLIYSGKNNNNNNNHINLDYPFN